MRAIWRPCVGRGMLRGDCGLEGEQSSKFVGSEEEHPC